MPLRVSIASSSARSRRRLPASRSIGSGSGVTILERRHSPAHRSTRADPMTPYPTAVGSKTTAIIARYGLTGSSLRLLGRLFKSGRIRPAAPRRTMDAKTEETRWWHGATLYQIYVRSWRDTNADGYGDLPGVIAGLDYLQWLGVEGIWLSPTMPSPDQDWGYDVSDYLAVHPELGTLADLDKLIAEAGQRGIRVVLDLVPNHTSSAHPWFADALSGWAAAHRGYYVWADPVAGGPPNNWLDATGASAWTLDDASGQYYLHNFLPGQPDLNWWDPRVHEEFREIIRFWFDRGVAGFRIDVAHGLYKDAQLRDNPPLAGGTRLDGGFGLKPVYSSHRPQTHGVYRDWRRIADGYLPQRLLLGETWACWPPTTGRTTNSASRSTSRSCSPASTPTRWPVSWTIRWRGCRPAPARSGWPPTTTSAASPPAGATGTSARRGSPCWCWPPCPAPRRFTTATRSR